MSTGSDRPRSEAGWAAAVAPAKINLGLEVLGKRADGYHDLRTVFQALDLHDDLYARPRADGVFALAVSGDEAAPAGEENLVVRALRALASRRAPGRGAEVRLVKRIPAGGGLGGGSSDAAAALLLGESIWGLDPDPDERSRLALGLGSDVPFFLVGGTALGEGRGEILTPLPPPPQWGWVLAIADFSVDTSRVFASDDKALTPVAQRLRMLQHALSMGDFLGFVGFLGNDLEPAALAVEPRLRGIRDWLRQRAPVAALSGSGSTWYAVTREPRAARDLAESGSTRRPAGLRRLTACRAVAHGAHVVGAPAS